MATVGELDVKALLDTPADKLSEIKAKALAYTLGHVHSDSVLDTVAHTFSQVQAKSVTDTLTRYQT